MKARLSLSPDQIRQLDAASATLRNDCRDRFRFDVIRHLELNVGLREVSNSELEQAIKATIGITPIDGEDCL